MSKVSQQTAASSLTGSESLYIVQSGNSRKVPVSNILTDNLFTPTGTGAVARSPAAKLGDILALADYDTAGHYATAVAAAGTAGSFSLPGLLSAGGMRVTGLSTATTGVGMELRYDTTGAGTAAITAYDRTNLVYKAFACDALTHVLEIEGVAALNITANRIVVGQQYVQGVLGLVGPLITTATAIADLGFSINLAAPIWVLDHTTGNIFPAADDKVRDFGSAAHRIGKVVTTIIDSGTTDSLVLRTNNGTPQITIANSGLVTLATIAARAAGDVYLVVDASGNIHKSAIGPAS